jgi:uncharacterized cupredoxin-like copper-binding protein
VPGRTILLRKCVPVLRPNKITIKQPVISIFPALLGKLLVLALALLMVACTSTTVATSKPTPIDPQESPTSGPIEQAPAPGSVEVKFTLVEFRIMSSVTVFHAGTHYYFVVSNHGHDTHEFMIMPDKPDGSPLSPDEQFKSMLMELEPITPGTTWTTNFTFSTPGKYEIACQMGRHYQAGMRLPITVYK